MGKLNGWSFAARLLSAMGAIHFSIANLGLREEWKVPFQPTTKSTQYNKNGQQILGKFLKEALEEVWKHFFLTASFSIIYFNGFSLRVFYSLDGWFIFWLLPVTSLQQPKSVFLFYFIRDCINSAKNWKGYCWPYTTEISMSTSTLAWKWRVLFIMKANIWHSKSPGYADKEIF